MKQLSHRIVWSVAPWFFCLLLPGLGSCKHEEETWNEGASIGFLPNVEIHWKEASTRSSADPNSYSEHGSLLGVVPLKSESGDSVYSLHVIEEEFASPSQPVEVGTRAAAVTTASMYPSFGVLTYVYPSTGTWTESLKPTFMYNVEVTQASGYTTQFYWPGADKKVRFFAYSPYNHTGTELSSQTTAGTPKLTYTVPGTVSAQKDLLVASSGELPGNKKQREPLTFKHALTAVKLKTAGMLPGRITKVELRGVYGKAVYPIGNTAWQNHSTLKNFVQDLNKAVAENTETMIVDNEATFMMIPQTVPAGAQLAVTYVDNLSGQSQVLTASIAGNSWPMGKVVTYKISLTSLRIEYEFSWDAPTMTFAHGDGYSSQSVISRAVVKDKTGVVIRTMDVPWTVSHTYNSQTSPIPPSWLRAPQGGNGGTDPFQIFIEAQTGETFDSRLQKNGSLGNEIRDLSLNNPGTQGRTTANCYLINKAGTYRFPLVYGNAMKNGSVHLISFQSNIGGASILTPFMRHNTENIQTAYIEDTPNDPLNNPQAELLWQDSHNLITDLRIEAVEGKKHIQFQVRTENFRQGNAVIALKQGGTVYWSWHIWVTPITTSNTSSLGTYSLLDVPIGWINRVGLYYAPRTTVMTVTQQRAYGTGASNTPATISKTITQREYDEFKDKDKGYALFYQYGRKDPFCFAQTLYNSSGGQVLMKTEQLRLLAAYRKSIHEGIQNPTTFYYRSGANWFRGSYTNLWNMRKNASNSGNMANTAVGLKTVYDPSPIGFIVPPPGMFSSYSDSPLLSSSLPGYVDAADAMLIGQGVNGDSWTSDAILYSGQYTGIAWSPLAKTVAEKHSAFGFSVRCVKE